MLLAPLRHSPQLSPVLRGVQRHLVSIFGAFQETQPLRVVRRARKTARLEFLHLLLQGRPKRARVYPCLWIKLGERGIGQTNVWRDDEENRPQGAREDRLVSIACGLGGAAGGVSRAFGWAQHASGSRTTASMQPWLRARRPPRRSPRPSLQQRRPPAWPRPARLERSRGGGALGARGGQSTPIRSLSARRVPAGASSAARERGREAAAAVAPQRRARAQHVHHVRRSSGARAHRAGGRRTRRAGRTGQRAHGRSAVA